MATLTPGWRLVRDDTIRQYLDRGKSGCVVEFDKCGSSAGVRRCVRPGVGSLRQRNQRTDLLQFPGVEWYCPKLGTQGTTFIVAAGQWYVKGGELTLLQQSSTTAGSIHTITGATGGVLGQITFPGNLVNSQWWLQVLGHVNKIGNAATVDIVLRVGTSGDASDPAVYLLTIPATPAGNDLLIDTKMFFVDQHTLLAEGIAIPNTNAGNTATSTTTHIDLSKTMFITLFAANGNVSDSYALDAISLRIKTP